MGSLIALVVDADEDWKNVEMPDSVSTSSAAPSTPSPAADTSAPVQAAEPPPGQ